jgi:hypothetical protein
MKVIVTLLTLAGMCALLAAETNAPTPLKAAGRHVVPDLSKWDANQNGRLERDELAAFQRDQIRERQAQQEARAQAAIAAGKLDEAARRTRMLTPTQLKQYDTNTNGLIDLEEWQVYRADVARRTAEKRAARLAAATHSHAPSTVISTNSPSRR